MDRKNSYAIEVSKVYEMINQINNDLENEEDMNDRSTKGIKKIIVKYALILVEVKQIKSYFNRLDSPFCFVHEHQFMLNALSEYVKATEDIVAAIKVESRVFTEKPYLIVLKIQNNATEKISKVAKLLI
ncbi:hypothetical protein ACFVP8_08405 [Viridibacillus arvi]|uniref:hypothetical protein n=1 Tax=Viridibacillus arvi TaxID=263475 RepID=UPI003697B1C7